MYIMCMTVQVQQKLLRAQIKSRQWRKIKQHTLDNQPFFAQTRWRKNALKIFDSDPYIYSLFWTMKVTLPSFSTMVGSWQRQSIQHNIRLKGYWGFKIYPMIYHYGILICAHWLLCLMLCWSLIIFVGLKIAAFSIVDLIISLPSEKKDPWEAFYLYLCTIWVLIWDRKNNLGLSLERLIDLS